MQGTSTQNPLEVWCEPDDVRLALEEERGAKLGQLSVTRVRDDEMLGGIVRAASACELQELELKESDMSVAGTKLVAEALRGHQSLAKLRIVGHGENFDADAARTLALSVFSCPKLCMLEMVGAIGDDGAAALVESASRGVSRLNTRKLLPAALATRARKHWASW